MGKEWSQQKVITAQDARTVTGTRAGLMPDCQLGVGPRDPTGQPLVLTASWAWGGCVSFSLAVLEVCQFSRDASVAEAWLIAQEPYLASRDFGHTVDSVEKLIKRHEAFEKSTASWAERFAALEKPTTVSGGWLWAATQEGVSGQELLAVVGHEGQGERLAGQGVGRKQGW